MRRQKFIQLLSVLLFAALGFGCRANVGDVSEAKKISQANQPESAAAAKLGVDYQRDGKIVYYKIPAVISNDKLIEIAGKLHAKEPGANIILVDDDSQAVEYIRYVNETKSGLVKTKMPKDWADKHIVANVQKHVNGKFVLCLGRGFQEVAELE